MQPRIKLGDCSDRYKLNEDYASDLVAFPSWQYAELARLWGVGFRIETVAELRDALEEAAKSPSFVIIEAMIGYRDLSTIAVKYIRASAKKAKILSQP